MTTRAPDSPTAGSASGIVEGLGALIRGARLGRYELLAPVGRGGMAVVWAARQAGSRGFSKVVAVKTMLPALRADPRFEAMLLAEANLASKIKHPNVCEVLDVGEDAGLLYLVMDWVRGDTLATLMADCPGGLPPGIAGRIALDAARGLHAAHEATADGAPLGIVHRDVSPQNILVSMEGVSKIADFGVAKTDASATTQAGYVKGKIRFMAPEQVYSESVDRRTDVFALGVVLYEATTGRHPFAGPTDVATLASIAGPGEAAPPSSSLAGYPAALEAVVLRALSKDPSARFASMAELAAELECALGDGDDADAVASFVREACKERIETVERLMAEPLPCPAPDELADRRVGAGAGRNRASSTTVLVSLTGAVALAIAIAAMSAARPADPGIVSAADGAAPLIQPARVDPPAAPASGPREADGASAELQQAPVVVTSATAPSPPEPPPAARAQGGQSALDASARNPPTSTPAVPAPPIGVLETRE